jgi:YD repeat-containing protein
MEVFKLNAQDYPIVPADMPGYLKEMKDIADAGIYSRTDWRYELQGGNVTAVKYKERVLKYDEQGRLIEIMHIDRKGENKSVIIFRYDKRNLPMLETEFLPTGELVGKTKYTYDTKGVLKDITWLNNFEFIYNRFSFDINDSAGKVTEWHFYSPDSVEQKIEYYYSDPEKGFITLQKFFTGEDKLENTIIWNRDSANYLINKEFKDPQGKLAYYLEYHYNTSGKVYQVIRILPNGSKIKKYEFNFEDSGLKTGEIEYNLKGEIITYVKYTYE